MNNKNLSNFGQELLKQGLLKLGFEQEICESLCKKMDLYIKELMLYNSAYNLTNTSDYDELVTRHILDSLSAFFIIKDILQKIFFATNEEVTIADMGSGGGLPGIPLAAAFLLEESLPAKRVNFHLVERMEKRCAFLENCVALLGLKNVEVLNSEAEKLPLEKYNLIIFRAFRPLDKKMTKTLLGTIKSGGYLCAYKAKMENIKEEMTSISSLVSEYKVEALCVPGLENSQRNLVIIYKEASKT